MLGVDDSPARFAPVREVPPLCGATPGGATSTPAVIIDLTPVRDRTGPARLLDVVPGRSKKVLKTWLAQRDQDWRRRVEVVATRRFHRVQERRRRRDPRSPGGHGPLRASPPWQEPSSTSAAAASSTRPPAVGTGRTTRSTGPDAPWTAGCFSDSACLCFRLPSLSPGNRFRPRRECDTLGLSEDGHDCISARSTRQYP